MPKFPDRLRALREEHDLSQMQLAKQLGISKSSVNMYERGEREPGLELMEAIADFFNVDMDYLHGKSDFKNKHAWLKDGQTSSSPAPEHDILDEVDIAFYGGYRELTDDDKETVRDMVRLMRDRRAKREAGEE